MIIHKHKFYLLEAIFIFIAIVYGSAYLFFLKQGMSGDSFFHYLSYKDIYLTIIHGAWPQFNLHSGYLLGSATNTFYPWLFFLPIILFINLISPLHWWGLAISIGMMIGLNITQWTGQKWLHSKRAGFYLAIFYCLSTIPFSEIYGQGDISAFYAMMIAPLAMYGWHQWLLHGYWKLMAVSLSIIVYVHVLTAGILILAFIILTIIQLYSLNLPKIIAGCKGVILSLCLTAFFWLPALILHASNNLFLPAGHGTSYMRTQVPFFDWVSLVAPSTANMWNIVTVVSILAIFLHYKYITKEDRSYILLCLLFLLVNNHAICIWLMQHTVLGVLQFTHRLCFITIFYFGLILIELGQRKVIHFKRYAYIVSSVLIIFLIIGLQEQVRIGNNQPAALSVHQSWHLYNRPLNYTPHELNQTRFLRALPKRYPDYYPNDLVRTSFAKASRHKHRHVVPVLKTAPVKHSALYSNDLVIHSNATKNVTLPIVTYHQQDYHVYNNRHLTRWSSHHSLLQCRIHKGTNHIHITAPLMWYRYVTMVISISTLLVLLFKRQTN